MWHRLLALLASLAADPAALDREPPRAAAAVAVAYAAQAKTAPTPAPQPDPPQECCKACNGTGKIVHPDGHVTDCPCPPTCECQKKKAAVSVLKSSAAPAAKAADRLVQPGGTAVCPDGKCNVRRVR